MANYNPASSVAEEFINEQEILDTVKYAQKNKNDLELIRSIIEKAKPVKTDTGYVCNGLTQRSKSSSCM